MAIHRPRRIPTTAARYLNPEAVHMDPCGSNRTLAKLKRAAPDFSDHGHLRERDADALGERLVLGLESRLHHAGGDVLDFHCLAVGGKHFVDILLQRAAAEPAASAPP